jgi:hypothetical protein
VKGIAIIDSAEGITKAMYAARNADMSTFLHEAIHSYTAMVERIDPGFYRQMLGAAGVDTETLDAADPRDRADTLRDAWERLAYAGERYFRDGEAPAPGVRRLFDRLKQWLKDIVDVLDSRKQLSPRLKALYDDMFGDRPAGRPEDGARNGGAEEMQLYQEEDRVINDPDSTEDQKARAIVQKAGKAYAASLLDPEDRKHEPTAALIMDARRIPDEAERAGVIQNIRDLRDRYAGTEAEFKAPNGKPSLLLETLGEERGRRAWYAVRTDGFKAWFGDWEALPKKAILEGDAVAAVFAKDIPIKNGRIIDTALEWIESHPQGTAKTVLGDIVVNRRGIRNSLNHKPLNPEKLYTLPAIKRFLKKARSLVICKTPQEKP